MWESLNSRYGGYWKLEKVFFLMKVSWLSLYCHTVTLVIDMGRHISFAFNMVFRKKKRCISVIYCEWKMASDKLDFGEVSV